MNRRGFLGSLVALVVAPKAVPLVPPAASPSTIVGYHQIVPVEFADGTITTWTVSSGPAYPYTKIGTVVNLKLPQRYQVK